jgi:spore photoproduct lyase
MVDTAKTFRPQSILLWHKVANHPEARRIVDMFPRTPVQVVERQRGVPVDRNAVTHPLIAGKRTLLIGAASRFVHPFDGSLGDVCCRPYLKLVPVSNGCPYFCTYCYLAHVYREHLSAIKINVNHDQMFRQIRKALATADGLVAFNMGEMLDSLALDHVTRLTSQLVPFFGGMRRGHLMLLTKSANIGNMLAVEPNRQVVVSWSLNTQRMIDAFEPGTASLAERIEAARQCRQHGYRIRFRIDPGMLYDGWQADYGDLVQQALASTQPENITLGMLRLVPGHFALAAKAYGQRGKNLGQHDLVERASDGKLRYQLRRRIAFYRHVINAIGSIDRNISTSLCRETPEVCHHFASTCHPEQCNCMAC